MASEKTAPHFRDLDDVLRERDVRGIVKLSHSTLYALVKRKAFPAPRRLSVRAVGWLKSDIAAWLQSREAK